MNSSTGHLLKLLLLFAVVKVVQVAILYFVPGQFDISSQILLLQYENEKNALSVFQTPYASVNTLLAGAVARLFVVLDRLVTWDAVYFADLFTNEITFEHQFVFCPLWWRLIKAFPGGFYSHLIFATAVTNACHFSAAVVLYFYTNIVFEQARFFAPRKMALAALAMFVLSPGAAFMTAPYSESIAALCSFLCLYMREIGLGRFGKKPNNVAYVVSGILAALAFGFRANCLLLGLVYLYDLRSKRQLAVVTGLVLGMAFLLAQWSNYAAVCSSGQRGEWCTHRVPSLFAYAQSHYWNNGFLKYWRPHNLPNFVFATPTIALLTASVRFFSRTYPVERIVPVLAVNMVFLVLLLLMWHVQIVTRIHTFLPVAYWLSGGLLVQKSRWRHIVVAYSVGWIVLQTSLFGAFLPPA